MKRFLKFVLGITIFVLAGGWSTVEAQIVIGETRVPAFEALESKTKIRFEPLPSTPATAVEPQLINGVPVDPKFFPAIFRMTTGGTCTAAVVGPAAVLLAAHCVDHLARISFVAGGSAIDGICEQAPGYVSVDDSEDWAMCLLEREIGGFPYESVDLETEPNQGDSLVLTGYGCTREGGPLDGLLRIGTAVVVGKPARWRDETSTIYTDSNSTDGGAGAILCPGDSGGPLYRFTGGFDDARQIVGVNSRTTYEYGISLFSATASRPGASFLRRWAERHGQMICGFNLIEGCR